MTAENKSLNMKSTVISLLSLALFPLVFGGLVKRSDTLEFTNCGDPDTDIIEISSLTFGPNPVVLPGNLTLGVVAFLNDDIIAPVSLYNTVEIKKDGVYENVPCRTFTGECYTPDMCQVLNTLRLPAFHNILSSFQCPFQKGTINVTEMQLEIPFRLGTPGDYHVKVNMTSAGRPAMCYETYFTFELADI